MSLPIHTKRLVLRRFRPGDSDDLLAVIRHPAVALATPEIKATKSGVQAYIEQQTKLDYFEKDKCFDLAIEHRIDGRVIGLLTLIRRRHAMGEIGWALDRDYWGQGYGTEAASGLIDYAFSALKLHRVQATTSIDNDRSIRVMERLQMRREGQLREAERHDGSWVDVVIYGLLHDDGSSGE